MSTFTDLEKDAASVDGFVNENGLIPTRRNGPKPSYQYLVDGWNAEIAAAILELNKSRGFRVVGTFANGFTYELFNDVGIDADGNSWIYVGAGAPNKVVSAGTVPSVGAGYEQVTFNSASGVLDSRGTNVQDYINRNLTPFKTVADMKAAAFLSTLPEFTRVEWQGYHTQSDGGSNWGFLRFGDHTEDGGSVFSIDANTYVEANLKGKKVSVLKFGAKCDGLFDDTSASENWNQYCKINTLRMYVPQGAILKYATSLDMTAAPSSFSEGTPVGVSIECAGEIYYTGTDKAIIFTGNLVGVNSYINSMRGAGRVSGDSTEGSGNESIGIYVGPNSGNTIKVNRVSDFRNGIVLDGCYNNTINYGSVYANDIGITFRGSAELGYGCINNVVKGNLSGGPYTSIATTPERIERCNRIGVWLQENARSNTFQGNVEYSVGSSGGIGLICEGDRNRIQCYGEGHGIGMRSFLISGNQNRLELAGGDALNADIAALKITGKDNELSLPQNRQTANTLTTFAPEAGQTEYEIDETTRFTNLNKEVKQLGIPSSNWNMLSGVVFNAVSPLTATSSINDRPSSFPSERTCVEISSSDNATRWYDSNTTGLIDSSHGDRVTVSIWVKRVTNSPKISILLRDAATGIGVDSFNTALTSDGWKKIQFLAKTGDATNLRLRVASRSFEAAEGYAYRIFNPYISQSLNAPEPKFVDSNYPLPKKEVSGYKSHVDTQEYHTQSIYDSHSSDTFSGNLLDVKFKPVVILTGNTGGNVINAINNMRDNSKVTILNSHTSPVTLTTTLGEWPTNISLINGRCLDIHKRGGKYYASL